MPAMLDRLLTATLVAFLAAGVSLKLGSPDVLFLAVLFGIATAAVAMWEREKAKKKGAG
jgi:hypothetical protein